MSSELFLFLFLEASLVSVNRCRISQRWQKTKTQFDRYCAEHHTSQPLTHRNPTNTVRHSQQRWVFKRQYAGSPTCCACASIMTSTSMEAQVHTQYPTGQCRSETHTASSFCGSKTIIWTMFLFSLTPSPLMEIFFLRLLSLLVKENHTEGTDRFKWDRGKTAYLLGCRAAGRKTLNKNI